MKRDWAYIEFVLEAIEASPRPVSTMTLKELIGAAREKFGSTEEVAFQIQATVLQLWYGEFIVMDQPRLADNGLALGLLKSITWKGYDLLESRRSSQMDFSSPPRTL